MGVGGQRHAPTALPPEKTRYPLHRRLGGPQGRTGYGISRFYDFIHLQIYGLTTLLNISRNPYG